MRYLMFFLFLGCGQTSTGFSDKEGDTDSGVAGTLSVEPTFLTWVDVEVGLSNAQEFTVSNVGEADLDIERIDITNSGIGVFNLDEDANRNILLASGESHVAIGVATFSEAGSAMGEFRIRSNDADTPDFRLSLCGYTIEQGDGVENCENLSANESQDSAD